MALEFMQGIGLDLVSFPLSYGVYLLFESIEMIVPLVGEELTAVPNQLHQVLDVGSTFTLTAETRILWTFQQTYDVKDVMVTRVENSSGMEHENATQHHDHQGSQPGPRKDPYSRFQEFIKKKFRHRGVL